MKNKPLDIVLLILKIVLPLLMIIPLVFFTYQSIISRIDYLEAIEMYGDPPGHYGMAEFLSALLIFCINVGIFVLIALCLLTAYLFKSSRKRDGHIKYFSWMLLAPIGDTVIYCLILILIVNIG